MAAILTNLETQGLNCQILQLDLVIGKGESQRRMSVPVPIPARVLRARHEVPVNVVAPGCFPEGNGEYRTVYFFRDDIYFGGTPYMEATSEEEAVLQVKKLAYSEERRLANLRTEVATMERLRSEQEPDEHR